MVDNLTLFSLPKKTDDMTAPSSVLGFLLRVFEIGNRVFTVGLKGADKRGMFQLVCTGRV